MRESWVRLLAWVLVVVFPASVLVADSTSAMLNASGNVTVNDSPVERAIAVFPGDKVRTGANSIATLTSEGSSVMVPGNSLLVFSKSMVNVLCGTAVVKTSRGMGVRVGKMLVQPARGVQSRFQITQKEGELQIVAREGALAVDNGATTTALQPGRMLTAAGSCMNPAAFALADDQATSPTQTQTQSQDQNQNNNKKKKGGAAPPPAAGSSTGNALLYGAAAAGAAAFLVWVTTRSSASNTTPAGP